MKELDEASLVERARSGDTAAMETLYRQHIGFLTASCSRYLSEREDVKDILQESFIKIFRSLDRFEYRGPGSVRAWMTRLVINETLIHIRNSKKGGFVEYVDNIPDTPDDAPDADINKIPPAELQSMIRRLPELYRVVFNLYVFSDMSHKQIATSLGIAEGSSASAFHRAKKMLAKMIKGYTTIQNL